MGSRSWAAESREGGGLTIRTAAIIWQQGKEGGLDRWETAPRQCWTAMDGACGKRESLRRELWGEHLLGRGVGLRGGEGGTRRMFPGHRAGGPGHSVGGLRALGMRKGITSEDGGVGRFGHDVCVSRCAGGSPG